MGDISVEKAREIVAKIRASHCNSVALDAMDEIIVALEIEIVRLEAEVEALIEDLQESNNFIEELL